MHIKSHEIIHIPKTLPHKTHTQHPTGTWRIYLAVNSWKTFLIIIHHRRHHMAQSISTGPSHPKLGLSSVELYQSTISILQKDIKECGITYQDYIEACRKNTQQSICVKRAFILTIFLIPKGKFKLRQTQKLNKVYIVAHNISLKIRVLLAITLL